MTKLRVIPFIVAIAGLVTVQPAMSAGLGNGDGPNTTTNQCTTEGNNCNGQALETVRALPYSGSRMNDPHNSPTNRRADEAWAKGDRKEACKWIVDAQSQANGDYAYYADKVAEYCADESGSSGHHQ